MSKCYSSALGLLKTTTNLNKLPIVFFFIDAKYCDFGITYGTVKVKTRFL